LHKPQKFNNDRPRFFHVNYPNCFRNFVFAKTLENKHLANTMKIVVNTRLVIPGKLDGIGWFAYQTFWRIARCNPDVEFHFIFDRKPSAEIEFPANVKPVVLSPQARHPLLYYWFLENSVTRYLKKEKPDLFVSSDGFLSLKYKGRQLPVIHDLNFMHRPGDLPYLIRAYYRYFFPRWAKIARRVATVSEHSKQDIARTFKINPDKIDVVYNGANDTFVPLDASKAQEARDKYTGGSKYFVYVGAIHKRKNIEKMLVAFDRFKEQSESNHKFVIIGHFLFGKGFVEKTLKGLQYREDIIFTGRLGETQTALLVGAAEALVLVSFFEGFGIPLMEAFSCAVPVITSNVTSLPEVAGNGGLVVNPNSEEEIANAMKKMAFSPGLRQKLAAQATIQRQKFSWDKTSDLMWESIKKSIGE